MLFSVPPTRFSPILYGRSYWFGRTNRRESDRAPALMRAARCLSFQTGYFVLLMTSLTRCFFLCPEAENRLNVASSKNSCRTFESPASFGRDADKAPAAIRTSEYRRRFRGSVLHRTIKSKKSFPSRNGLKRTCSKRNG